MPKTTKPVTPKQTAQAEQTAQTPQPMTTPPMSLDVRIYPVNTNGALKANASVNVNGYFAVTNVRVLEGSKGLFVSMPQYKGRNGEYKDICFPCTREAKQAFDGAVLDAYRQTLTQEQSAAPRQTAPEAPQSQPVMAGM